MNREIQQRLQWVKLYNWQRLGFTAKIINEVPCGKAHLRMQR
jgi:hypothetical protein